MYEDFFFIEKRSHKMTFQIDCVKVFNTNAKTLETIFEILYSLMFKIMMKIL